MPYMLTCLLMEHLWPELAIYYHCLCLPAKPKRSDVPQVNFPDRNINKLRVALENTYAIVWVRSTRNSRWARSGQLLGFARAFSDRALTATIWDVAVGHPALLFSLYLELIASLLTFEMYQLISIKCLNLSKLPRIQLCIARLATSLASAALSGSWTHSADWVCSNSGPGLGFLCWALHLSMRPQA